MGFSEIVSAILNHSQVGGVASALQREQRKQHWRHLGIPLLSPFQSALFGSPGQESHHPAPNFHFQARQQKVLKSQESSDWESEQIEKAQQQFNQRGSREKKYLREAREAANKQHKIPQPINP